MKNRIFSVAIILTIASTVSLFGCKKNKDDNNNNMNSVNISIQNRAFSSSSVQVVSGGTVTWKNNDNEDHTVTANDGSFESGHITPGSTYSKTFTTIGTYSYHCSLHPEMTGTVVVVATGSGGGGGGY